MSSYNTRRTGQGMGTGGGGGGVGRGGSQILYHQQPPAQQRTMPARNQPTSNYSTQQPIQTVNTSYGNQGNAPAYSAQSTPPPSSQTGYSTQPGRTYQQPSYQTQPPPPQQPQPIKVEAPPAPTVTAPPPPPAPSTPAPAPPAPPAGMDVDTDSTADGTSEVKPRPWLKKKVPGFKVNKRIKRRRQNARLRKLLQPKNAIMVLNELKTGIKFTFQEHTNALTQTMFVVNAEVDGKTFVGQSLSKPLAKQNAAENALKALLLEKMAEAVSKASEITSTESMETNNGPATSTSGPAGSGGEEGSEGGSDGTKNAPEDDVPWGSLACFALYKLFTEWQNQGTHVPIPKQQVTPVVAPLATPAKAGAPAPMKKIPENPTERHPVMLLNQLKPGVQFTEISREGTPPNLTFTLGVTIDGKNYVGVAKNKKDAKKEAAKSALAGSFNIHYES